MPSEVGDDRPAPGGDAGSGRPAPGDGDGSDRPAPGDGDGSDTLRPSLRPGLRRRSWEIRAQGAIDSLRSFAYEVALTCEPNAEPWPQPQGPPGGRSGSDDRRWLARLRDWWAWGPSRHQPTGPPVPGCTHGTPWCERYRHVLLELRIAESYLDRRGTPTTWWRGLRVEGAWGHIHNATVTLVELASSRQLFVLAPRLLGIIDGYLDRDDPERRAVQSWFDELPKVATPPLRAGGCKPSACDRGSAGDTDASTTDQTPDPHDVGKGVTDRARGELASALRTAYDRIASEYQRLRRFEWTIIGSTVLILGLVALLTLLGWLQPQVVPLCFPDPDEAATTAEVASPVTTAEADGEAQASPEPTEGAEAAGATTVGEQQPVCPSRDRPVAAATGDAGDEGGQSASDASPSSSGDVATVVLFGLIGASLTSVPFVVRRAPPTSVPISGIRVAQAGLKAALGMLSAVVGLLFLRAGVVPGFTQVDTRSQILIYAILFGAAQQIVTRAIDSRSNTLIGAVTADDSDQAAASRPQ